MTNRKKIIIFIVYFSALLTSIFTLLDLTTPTNYKLLYLLPLSYSLSVLISIPFVNRLSKNISLLIILSLYFMRMVVIPYLLFKGNYTTFVLPGFADLYFKKAILLIIYEYIIIFIFILYLVKKNSIDSNREINIKEIRATKKYESKFKIYFSMILFFIILLLVRYPELIKANFVFLLSDSVSKGPRLEYASLTTGGSGPLGILVTILNTFFWFAQVLLPPIIITKIYNKKINIRGKILLSIILLLPFLLIGTESRADSIEISIVILTILSLLYGSKFNKYLSPMLLAISSIIFFGLANKAGMGINYEELSKLFSAYFSGPQNVAIALKTKDLYPELNMFKIFSDFILKIPYLSSFFYKKFKPNTNFYFNNLFTDMHGWNIGQIIPNIGLGNIYFSYILSPLLSLFPIYISYQFEKKAKLNKRLDYKYYYYLAMIKMTRTVVISNMLSGVMYLSNLALVFLILNKLNKGFENKRMEEKIH